MHNYMNVKFRIELQGNFTANTPGESFSYAEFPSPTLTGGDEGVSRRSIVSMGTALSNVDLC